MEPAEAERVEAQLLDDEEFFATMRSAEDDLFDDYARGELGESDRDAFLARYGSDRERLTFARALGRRTARGASSAAWIGLAAAAVLLTVSVAIFVAPWKEDAPSAAVVHTAMIALGTARSGEDVATIDLPSNATLLRLSIRLDPNDRYDDYSLSLGNTWRAVSLQASEKDGDLFLTADVPASAVPDGTHELEVRGGGEALGFVTVKVRRDRP